jgi:hypothetical protein
MSLSVTPTTITVDPNNSTTNIQQQHQQQQQPILDNNLQPNTNNNFSSSPNNAANQNKHKIWLPSHSLQALITRDSSSTLSNTIEGGASGSFRSFRKGKRHLVAFPIPHNIRLGDEHPPLPHVWVTLFYDLTIVSCFQQANTSLARGILINRPLEAFGLYLAYISVTTFMFIAKMNFNARFEMVDVFHRFVEIFQGGLVAVAGLSMTSIDQAEIPQSGHSLAFSLACLVFCLVDFLIMYEISWNWRKPRAAKFAENQLTRLGLPVVFSLATVILQLASAPFIITVVLWLFIHAAGFVEIMIRIYARRSKLIVIPMHVEFAMKRVNDLFMLTFGECVIQIVTTTSTLQGVQFAVTFGASYVQIALVALIFYCVVPETIDESVTRRNGFRAMINFVVMPLGVASILSFATGLSLEFQDRPEGTTLLCYSLAATLFYLNLVRVFHIGFKEEFLITSKGKRCIKLLLWLGKFGTIAGVAAVSTDATLSKNKAAMSVVLASLIGACHIFCLVDLWIFHEEFLKIVDGEVTKRRKLLLEQQQQEQQHIFKQRELNLNNNSNSEGETFVTTNTTKPMVGNGDGDDPQKSREMEQIEGNIV